MKKIKMLVIGMIMMVISMVSGRSSIMTESNQRTFVVQYATLKLLDESDSIASGDVLSSTHKVRELVEENEELRLSDLGADFRSIIDLSKLQPSDRLLVTAIINRVEGYVSPGIQDRQGIFTIEQKTTLLQLLDDIDEAAMISR